MGDDDGRGPIHQRAGEDFARMGRAPIQQSDGDHAHIDDFVGAVDTCAKQMFRFAIGKVPDMGQQIGRGFDAHTVGFDAPPACSKAASR